MHIPILDKGTGQLGFLLCGYILAPNEIRYLYLRAPSGADIVWKSLPNSEVTLLFLKAFLKTNHKVGYEFL